MISFDNEMIDSIKDDIKGINDVGTLRDLKELILRKIKQISELNVMNLKIGTVFECVNAKGKSSGFYKLTKINRTRVVGLKLNDDLTVNIFASWTIPFSMVVATDLKVNEKTNSGKAPAKARNPLEKVLDSAIARDMDGTHTGNGKDNDRKCR